MSSHSVELTPEPSQIQLGPFKISIPVICLLWGMTLLGGLLLSADYQWRPAVSGETPERWPATPSIASPAGKPILLMFLHPHCPCSRSSLAQLKALLADEPGKAVVQILFFDSPEFKLRIEESDNWKLAHNVPGVTVALDKDGKASRMFGACASGTVVLYDGAGQLQFTGGITAGRGHVGTNPAVEAVTACLNGATVTRRDYPVFGCPISRLPTESKPVLR